MSLKSKDVATYQPLRWAAKHKRTSETQVDVAKTVKDSELLTINEKDILVLKLRTQSKAKRLSQSIHFTEVNISMLLCCVLNFNTSAELQSTGLRH